MYEDLGSYDLMKPILEELLAEYNSKKKPMNLVFFDDAIEHLTRIHRILRLQQVGLPSTSHTHRVSQDCAVILDPRSSWPEVPGSCICVTTSQVYPQHIHNALH